MLRIVLIAGAVVAILLSAWLFGRTWDYDADHDRWWNN